MLSIRPAKTLRYALTSFFLIAFSLPSLAVTTHDWQGSYFGAYLGGAFGYNHASTNAGSLTDTSYFTTQADINAINNAGTYSKSPSSMLGGIQLGQDLAWKQLVYGIVLDYSALSLGSSKRVTNAVYRDSSDQYSVHTSINTNWLVTVRGRIACPITIHWPTLFYVTGGMALTSVKVSNNFSDNSSFAGMGGGHTSSNQIGWTVGGGLEVALIKHLSMDLEYSYVGMPSIKTTNYISNTQAGFGIPAQSLTNPFTTTAHLHANLVKIGLNYRFNG